VSAEREYILPAPAPLEAIRAVEALEQGDWRTARDLAPQLGRTGVAFRLLALPSPLRLLEPAMDSEYEHRWHMIATQVGDQRISGNLQAQQETGHKPNHGQDLSGEVDGEHIRADDRLQSQLQPVPAAGSHGRQNDGTPRGSCSQVIKTLVGPEED
jgi:hypothetical protein